MIKINLLVKGAVGPGAADGGMDLNLDAGTSDIQRLGLIRLVIILIGPALLYFYQTTNLPDKQKVVAIKQTELNKLMEKNEKAKSAVEEIKKYKTDEARLKDQINTIESLRKDRMREVRILDLIQREMPERMWLSRLEMKENRINITGYAAADSELTQFMDVLSRSVFMVDISLVRAAEKIVDGATLKEFSISAGLKKTEIKMSGGGAG